jgi:hypothetical protein
MEAFVAYARRCSEGATMEKIGVLHKQPGGRWAVCRPGHDPTSRRATSSASKSTASSA